MTNRTTLKDGSVGAGVVLVTVPRGEGGVYPKLNNHFLYKNMLDGIDPSSSWKQMRTDGYSFRAPTRHRLRRLLRASKTHAKTH